MPGKVAVSAVQCTVLSTDYTPHTPYPVGVLNLGRASIYIFINIYIYILYAISNCEYLYLVSYDMAQVGGDLLCIREYTVSYLVQVLVLVPCTQNTVPGPGYKYHLKTTPST